MALSFLHFGTIEIGSSNPATKIRLSKGFKISKKSSQLKKFDKNIFFNKTTSLRAPGWSCGLTRQFVVSRGRGSGPGLRQPIANIFTEKTRLWDKGVRKASIVKKPVAK